VDLDAPGLHVGAGEAQHGERDAELRRPALPVARHLARPDGVPVERELGVVVDLPVDLHAGRRELEGEGRVAVVAAVDGHRDPVGLDVAIAAREAAGDAARVGVEAADGDVDVRVVVGHAELRPLRRRRPLRRLDLGEAVLRRHRRPDGIVEAAVDDRGLRHAHRGDARQGALRREGRGGGGDEEEDGEAG
jgi:hypothetical protein